MGSLLVTLNGAALWAYVVETDDGLRVRLGLDEWQRLELGGGQRVPVRLQGKEDVWLFITHVAESPPIVGDVGKADQGGGHAPWRDIECCTSGRHFQNSASEAIS